MCESSSIVFVLLLILIEEMKEHTLQYYVET